MTADSVPRSVDVLLSGQDGSGAFLASPTFVGRGLRVGKRIGGYT